MVAQKEALLKNGETVYLELAPFDPRSFFQGDYMAVNYAVCNEMNHLLIDQPPVPANGEGQLVIRIDSRNVGTFVRIYQGGALGADEHLITYRHRGWRTSIGAESYFIPEGSGEKFDKAKYGELKLAPDGTVLIVALCDQDLKRIDPSANRN
jgi:uncharacterized membrane-anchored protein